VDGAEFTDGAFCNTLAVGGAGDVAGLEDRAAAVLGDFGGYGLSGRFVYIREDNRGAGIGWIPEGANFAGDDFRGVIGLNTP
jgi:hypothetical protein